MYGFYREVTIDKTKCGSADSTDFVVTIAGTYAYLATVANGGKVQNSSGYDIGVFLTSAIATKLDWELVEYDPTTGWVKINCRVGTLTVATDLKIYLAYGDATISTFQGNVAGTWNSGFVLAANLPNGTTLTANDSTSNGNNGTINGPVATFGPTGGAASFDGTNDNINFGAGSSIDDLVNKTFSVTLKRGAIGLSVDQGFAAKVASGGGFGGWWFYTRRDSDATNGGKLKLGQAWTGSTFETALWRGTTKINDTTNFYRIAFTYAAGSTANAPIFYIDGSVDATVLEQAAAGTRKTDAAFDLLFGERSYGDQDLNGILADARLSNVIRNGDWLLAEANNLLSPSTFYSIGSEVVIGTLYTLTITGGQATSGEIFKKTLRLLVGVQDEAGDIFRKVKLTFLGTQDETGILSFKTKKAFSGAMDMTGILTNRTLKIFSGLQDMAGTLSLLTKKVFTGGLDMTGILVATKRQFITLVGTMDMGGVITNVVVPTVISAYNNFMKWWIRRRYH